MNKFIKLDIKTITIILLLLIILIIKTCNNGNEKSKSTIKIDGKTYEVLKHDTVISYKTNTTIKEKKGKDIYHDTTIYIDVPIDVPIDTTAILKDFYAKNVYNDTLWLNDSLGFVTINDTISKNKILNRIFTSKIKEKHTKETLTVVEPPKRQVYFGINAGTTSTDIINNVGISGLYKTKNDKIYQLGIGTIKNNTQVKPYIYGGFYWKIKF